MTVNDLFDDDKILGIFRGFSEGGLEFHADILIRYQDEFQDSPMHGQFILVQLATPQEAIVGRITSMRPEGRLSTSDGEEYIMRAIQEKRDVSRDIMLDYVRYRVSLRVLGVIRTEKGKLNYAASHRRLPHVGSRVAFPNDDVLKFLARHDGGGQPIGFLSFGEFVYGHGDPRFKKEPWMQVKSPAILPSFDIQNLVARRTFIFARAGFGKSNLNKLLFSQLYKANPHVPAGSPNAKPVGTIIFDPEGEYFWPDDQGKPGLCDVPELEEKIVLFTPKDHGHQYYESFKAGGIRLDIRRLKPSDIIEIALNPAQQSQQNVRKLSGLAPHKWRELVDLIDEDENRADLNTIKEILHLEDQSSDAEAVAARSNMTHIVKQLHSRDSQLLDMLLQSLREGKLCIIDISQFRGMAGLNLAGILLRKIFDHNQEQFTKTNPDTIPVVAVIEEAQAVLGGSNSNQDQPFVAWVKEGRKYNLGAVLVTQQPGSIGNEILSQGDNWFIFHLLSKIDLDNVRKANAHFSNDLLSSLLNEPIPGNGVFWTSTKSHSEDVIRAYPIPVRVMNFEETVDGPVDLDGGHGPGKTYAATVLKPKFAKALQAVRKVDASVQSTSPEPSSSDQESTEETTESDPEAKPVDVFAEFAEHAMSSLESDDQFLNKLRGNGIPWYGIMKELEKHLPESLESPDDFTHQLVPNFMNRVSEMEGCAWDTERRPKKSGEGKTTWVVLKK